MTKMIKDHSGSWMLSSGILTLSALAAYFGKTPGCNKTLCLSYDEQGMHRVYFAEDEVADSVRVGYAFVHDGDAYAAYRKDVDALQNRMERFVDETLLAPVERDRQGLASLWETSNDLRCAYLALYQLTNDSFVSKAYEEIDRFLSAHNGVIDKQEVLQCLSAVDMRELYLFRENADWLSIVRSYLDGNKAVEGDLLRRLDAHAQRYGFLMMGRSQFMCGADRAYYLEKLQAYTEAAYRDEFARHTIQRESALHTEERAAQCARNLGMPEPLYLVLRRLAELAHLRLKMREVSQKLIVAREKACMPHIYRLVLPHFDALEFRFLLPAEIADMIRADKPERFYQDLRDEIRRRREAVCMELAGGAIRVTSGQEAKDRFSSYSVSDGVRASTYTGIPVCGRGTITGRVVKLDENATQPAEAQGRIVLCKSLIPNMVGACVQALAVITEEGGYSSHASVLCREMQIACVVGASGILNLCDGETVKVDLDAGRIQCCAEVDRPAECKYLRCFVELSAVDDSMPIGGKARQLSRIRESTPDAFVITTEGFSLLEENRPEFVRQLAEHLQALNADTIILRSSFAEEDSQKKTYAGIFESYGNVGVHDMDRIVEILHAMIESYRHVPGFYQTEASGVENCSIIVQKMVAPTLSGVAISGYVHKGYEQILVEYVLGHLSGLMDGKVKPMRGFFRTADFYAGERAHHELMPPFLIPSDQPLVDRLIEQVIRLEAYYTGSIEIEWAIEGDRLYLLQVRKEPTRG